MNVSVTFTVTRNDLIAAVQTISEDNLQFARIAPPKKFTRKNITEMVRDLYRCHGEEFRNKSAYSDMSDEAAGEIVDRIFKDAR